jgi:D-alanyl-D-alanine carboxypeptidase
MKILSKINLMTLKILLLVTVFAFTNLSCTNNSFSATNSNYSSLVMDAKTGEIIHHVNGYKKRYPASLTKIMTLYILFDEIKKGSIKKTDLIYFSRNASNKEPSKLGIPSGRSISVDIAIKSLAIKSANDVATAVAEHISGTEVLFSNKMSVTAKKLGMQNTVFKNASGLPNSKQITTPYDMAILGLRIKNDFPNEYYVFGLKSFSYNNKKYISHNKLLFSYEGANGIKTGFTNASGFNIVTSIQKDNKHAIAVVMGGSTGSIRDNSMINVLNKSFPKLSEAMNLPIKNPYKIKNINYLPEIKRRVSNNSYFDNMKLKVNRIINLVPHN